MKIKSDLKMIKKGVGYIHRLAPGNLALKLVKNVFNAVIPFLDLERQGTVLCLKRQGTVLCLRAP